jgi:hypothetical protein
MKDFTRVCRIEPRAYGLWLNSANSCEIEFPTRGIHDIFPTTTKKKTLIFKLQILFDRAADKIIMPLRGDRHR